MADQALNDFLSGVQMTELAQSEAIKRGLPRTLPPELFEVSPEKPVGMGIQYEQIKGNRQLATLVHHLSPSRRAETPGVTRQFATALGSKEHFVIDSEMLMALKSNLPVIAERARRRVVTNMADFRSRMDNLQTTLVTSAFSQGAIYSDDAGNVLPTSSGAYNTISYGVNSYTHTSTIGASSITVGDWSSASTDITQTMRTLRQQNVFSNNYNLRNVLYGAKVPSFLATNTSMQTYFSRQPELNKEFVSTNEIPKGCLDYNWYPMANSYMVDKSGTVQQLFADNQIVVFPEVDPGWYEFYEAGTLVPRTFAQVGTDIDAMVDQCFIANGFFSYGEFSTNPVHVKSHCGWYGLPVIKVPGTVYIITVS